MSLLTNVIDDLQALSSQTAAEFSVSEFRGQDRVVLSRTVLHAAFDLLRNRWEFDLLNDITCVDYLSYRGARDRFGLVYILSSTRDNARLVLRVMLNEPDLKVASAVPFWDGADWMEREVWDMFGIRFEGHPNLRRILLPEEFTAHPLRKDYPMQGRGERHHFDKLTRAEA